MASDVRECDVCGTIFKIIERGCSKYEPMKLPYLPRLEDTITYIKTEDRLRRISTHEYDVCNHCLLRLCEVLQGLHSIRGEQQ